MWNKLHDRATHENWLTVAIETVRYNTDGIERRARIRILQMLHNTLVSEQTPEDKLKSIYKKLGKTVLQQSFSKKPLMADYPEYWLYEQETADFLLDTDANNIYQHSDDDKDTAIIAKGCWRAGHGFFQNDNTFETKLADMFRIARYSKTVDKQALAASKPTRP